MWYTIFPFGDCHHLMHNEYNGGSWSVCIWILEYDHRYCLIFISVFVQVQEYTEKKMDIIFYKPRIALGAAIKNGRNSSQKLLNGHDSQIS